MDVFNHSEFDSHEQLVFFNEPQAGLKAIVAIHNTSRGPALGGCRMYPYATEAAALTDVLRLSKGMRYKSAISGLPLGGGKSIIIGDPRRDKSQVLFEAFGRCLERLGGRYIVAEDSGTTVEDLRIIASQTQHISGIGERSKPDGGVADGDPSPATAFGVFQGITAAAEHVFDANSLTGLTVAVQGVGNVGRRLVAHLVEAGANVVVTDVYPDRVCDVVSAYQVESVEPAAIYSVTADVFAPCALGAVLNDHTISQLRVKIIAGAANNQLGESRHADSIQRRDICYVPDFAVNAGGVIDIAGYLAGLSYTQSMAEVANIYDTVTEVLRLAGDRRQTTLAVAEEIAISRMRIQ